MFHGITAFRWKTHYCNDFYFYHNGQMTRWTDGSVEGWMNEGIDGWMSRWMDEGIDGWMSR